MLTPNLSFKFVSEHNFHSYSKKWQAHKTHVDHYLYNNMPWYDLDLHHPIPGPVFCLFLRVSTDYAQSITVRVTEQ